MTLASALQGAAVPPHQGHLGNTGLRGEDARQVLRAGRGHS